MPRELRHAAVVDGSEPFHRIAIALAGRKRSTWNPETPECCWLPTRLCSGLSTLPRLDTSHIAARPASFFRAQDFSSQRTSLAVERAALERRAGVEPGLASPGSDRRRHRRVFNARAITCPIVGRSSDPSRLLATLGPLRGFALDGCSAPPRAGPLRDGPGEARCASAGTSRGSVRRTT